MDFLSIIYDIYSVYLIIVDLNVMQTLPGEINCLIITEIPTLFNESTKATE